MSSSPSATSQRPRRSLAELMKAQQQEHLLDKPVEWKSFANNRQPDYVPPSYPSLSGGGESLNWQQKELLARSQYYGSNSKLEWE
ncbi:hypothetical protein BASA81_000277 [Batrachochytrium salamandrivorans]|nr:hypothetical protein BASA81_000277 [Batrachochytrium salamandrivorans]